MRILDIMIAQDKRMLWLEKVKSLNTGPMLIHAGWLSQKMISTFIIVTKKAIPLGIMYVHIKILFECIK